MTIQKGEVLFYNGQIFNISEEPLNSYLVKNKIELQLTPLDTSCWRGYIGQWEIIGDRLFLKTLSGHGFLLNREKYHENKSLIREKTKAGEITPQENGHLLKDLKNQCLEEINLTVGTLFNGAESVFADWYSGTIHLSGDLLFQKIDNGYNSENENVTVLKIENGHVVMIQ